MDGIKCRVWSGNDWFIPKPEYLFGNKYFKELLDKTGIICQWTGLRDINGNDVFVGDVLDKHFKLQIEFYKGSFGYWYMFDFIPICNVADKIEVMEIIGNIYENPELRGEI